VTSLLKRNGLEEMANSQLEPTNLSSTLSGALVLAESNGRPTSKSAVPPLQTFSTVLCRTAAHLMDHCSATEQLLDSLVVIYSHWCPDDDSTDHSQRSKVQGSQTRVVRLIACLSGVVSSLQEQTKISLSKIPKWTAEANEVSVVFAHPSTVAFSRAPLSPRNVNNCINTIGHPGATLSPLQLVTRMTSAGTHSPTTTSFPHGGIFAPSDDVNHPSLENASLSPVYSQQPPISTEPSSPRKTVSTSPFAAVDPIQAERFAVSLSMYHLRHAVTQLVQIWHLVDRELAQNMEYTDRLLGKGTYRQLYGQFMN